jgi:hypothetical protein
VRATLRRLAEGSPEIHAHAIHTRAHAGELRVRIAALDAERLSVQIEGASALESVVPLPPLATVSLLAAQLSDRSIDAQFRAALATSRELVKAAIR